MTVDRIKLLAIPLLTLAAVPLTVGAQSMQGDKRGNEAHGGGDRQTAELVKKHGDGVRLTSRAISGAELLEADVLNIARPIGRVEDAVLNDAGTIEYLEYSTSAVRDLDEGGYAPVGELELEPSPGFGVDVDLSESTDLASADPITLSSRREQDMQMLSNILRGHLLVDGDSYEIRDVVFDPQGKARYFIVGRTEGGFLQPGDAFAVPFENTHYIDGAWRTGLSGNDLIMLVAYLG